jgi:hypothetical protein
MQLIAAFPPGTDSIMTYDVSALLQKDNIGQPLIESVLQSYVETSKRRGKIFGATAVAIRAANPIYYAEGGSGFGAPRTKSGKVAGAGQGAYVQRAIWVLKDAVDLGSLNLQKLTCDCDLNGVEVYHEWVHIQEPNDGSFMCFPLVVANVTPRIIVMAQSMTDLVFMIGSLQRSNTEVAPHWRDLLRIMNISDPILILRTYPTSNWQDATSPICQLFDSDGRVHASPGIAVSVKPPIITIQIYWWNREIDPLIGFYKQILRPEAGFQWSIRTINDVVETTIVIPNMVDWHTPLRALFGENLFL